MQADSAQVSIAATVRVCVLALAVSTTASALETPARFKSGLLPAAPPLALEGGVVVAELGVSATGEVVDFVLLEAAPPFAEPLRDCAETWRFHPAENDGKPVPSAVLAVALFGAPVLSGSGTAAASRRESDGSPEIPYPLSMESPPFPPSLVGDGAVLVEVVVDPTGTVAEARIAASRSDFDEPSLQAARRFRFRPAIRAGTPVASTAYVAFVFRQPVTPTQKR